jgi:Mrp family chromosome partitioning ATPase
LIDSVARAGNCAVLSWGHLGGDLPPDAVTAVLDAAVRGCERVVVDLPRLGADGDGLLAACDEMVMVVPATVRATLAAGALASRLDSGRAAVKVVVRDPRSGAVRERDVVRALGLPVVASLRSESGVAVAADRGEPPIRGSRGSLSAACRQVLAAAEPRRAA